MGLTKKSSTFSLTADEYAAAKELAKGSGFRNPGRMWLAFVEAQKTLRLRKVWSDAKQADLLRVDGILLPSDFPQEQDVDAVGDLARGIDAKDAAKKPGRGVSPTEKGKAGVAQGSERGAR